MAAPCTLHVSLSPSFAARAFGSAWILPGLFAFTAPFPSGNARNLELDDRQMQVQDLIESRGLGAITRAKASRYTSVLSFNSVAGRCHCQVNAL